MFNFQQKRKFKSIFNSRITQVLFLVLAILIFWSAWERYQIAKEMSDKRLVLEEEIKELKVRKDTLDERVEYLSSERGMEAEVRRQFDVAREGEQVVVILESELEKATTTELTPTSTAKTRPWYKFW